jgi:hypothetical protein
VGSELPQPPESVRSSIAELWNTRITVETAFKSGAFRLLEINCASTYSGLKGSRFAKQTNLESARRELQSALQNFIRWNGAPWYGSLSPDADETALRLHEAFLAKEVNRTYFVPLDRLSLEDCAQRPRQRLEHARFGPNEILLLKTADLATRVRSKALARFDQWHTFPIEHLHDFYWLVVSTCEEAGPIWSRTWHAMLHETLGEIGHLPIFEPIYPQPVEDALFVLLHCLVRKPSEIPWKPFAVPWTYSVTDDSFSEPHRTPDHSALTRIPVGDPDDEFEAPDRSEIFETTRDRLEEALGQRWLRLQASLARGGTERANFHPLTKHFFVKALTENGIDEIVANISCIEATLMLNESNGRNKMMKRFKHLVPNGKELEWLKHGYDLRDGYLHSLGDMEWATSWQDRASIRWSVTKAVDRYLELTEMRSELNREKLLRSLEN